MATAAIGRAMGDFKAFPGDPKGSQTLQVFSAVLQDCELFHVVLETSRRVSGFQGRFRGYQKLTHRGISRSLSSFSRFRGGSQRASGVFQRASGSARMTQGILRDLRDVSVIRDFMRVSEDLRALQSDSVVFEGVLVAFH